MAENMYTEEGGGMMVDLSGVDPDKGMEVLPRGIYPCVIHDCTYGNSQSSGNPMWTWVLEVESGEYQKRKLYFHLPFMDSMRARLKKVLIAVAPELAQQAFDPEKIANEGYLLGKKLRARVDIRPYQGQPRNNVRDLLAPEDGAASFM